MPQFLSRPDGATIAYDQTTGSGPGVIFLHGLMSDRGGNKARALSSHCANKGYGFLRYDMYGHGESSGRFEDGSISRWSEDAAAVIDQLTTGPQIVIGSSMGGWVMLKLALSRPGRVRGLLGIAPGPDFTEDLMWQEFSPVQKDAVMTQGHVEIPSDYNDGPYRISRTLIDDGRANLMLRQAIPITCPVRILQGQRDTAIPWQRALTLADKLTGDDVEVLLVKDGDHRLSRPQDLAHMGALLDTLIEGQA